MAFAPPAFGGLRGYIKPCLFMWGNTLCSGGVLGL
jgi:hypothetical protein